MILCENSKRIALCIAALINNGNLSEIFIPNQGIGIEPLLASISSSDSSKPTVYLIHGMFDSYSISLFNSLSNLIRCWDKNTVVLLSLEGIPAHMISTGVWNQALYIDGDVGFENSIITTPHSFNLELDINTPISYEMKEYKRYRKSLLPFSNIISNIQINLYARYLSSYNISLNESSWILSQMIVIARSSGTIEGLNELFHENGISNGEKMINNYL